MPKKVVLLNIVEGDFKFFKDVKATKHFRIVDNNSGKIYFKLPATIKHNKVGKNCVEVSGGIVGGFDYVHWNVWVQELNVIEVE